MVDAKDMDEVYKILGETEYMNMTSSANPIEDYENILSGELKRVYKNAYELAKDSLVVDLLALKYDYHNLKVLVKEKFLDRDLSDLYVGISSMDFDKLKLNYKAGNMKELDPRIRENLEKVEKDFEEKKDSQRIDILLDKAYFNHLYDMAVKTQVPLFKNYAEDLIDFTNIRTLVRVKSQKKDLKFLEDVLIENGKIDLEIIRQTLNNPLDMMVARLKAFEISSKVKKGLEAYGESGRLSEFERLMDNYIMDINKPSKYVNFGPEPIFSYIIAKETEIKTLRIIIVSKLNGLSPDDIRERLRDLYV